MIAQPFRRNRMGLRCRKTREHRFQLFTKIGQREALARELAEVQELLLPLPLHVENQSGLIHLCPQPIGGVVQPILVSKEDQVVQLLIQRFVSQSSLPMMRAQRSAATFFSPPTISTSS